MTRDRRYRFREDDLAIIKKVAPRVDSSLQALFMLAGACLFYKEDERACILNMSS